jgi:hypothetical protein
MKLIIPFLLAIVSASGIRAQTAEEIISKHIDAIGGKDVISKIKSQVISSEVSVMGVTLTAQTTILAGKGLKNIADFQGQSIIQVITPTSGWTTNPLQEITEPQALPDDQVRAAQGSLDIAGELTTYKERGSKIALVGTEAVDSVNALKLKLTNKDGLDIFYFIDPATYYIIKREFTANVNGEDVKGITLFSNYKKTDSGLVMAFTTVSTQGFEIKLNVKKVEFNKEIDPKIFNMP